jgi:hypothetical protein
VPQPWPRSARVRVSLAGQALAASPLSLGRCPRCLGGGVRCTPSPCKGGPGRRGKHNTIPMSHLHGLTQHLPGPPAPSGLPPLSSLSREASRRACVGDNNHHCDTPSCCGVSRSLFQSLYFRISAGNKVPGVIVVAVRVWVRGGAARAVPESLRQVLHDLEVGYDVFDSNACAVA